MRELVFVFQVESNNEATLKKEVEALNRRCMVSFSESPHLSSSCIYMRMCAEIFDCAIHTQVSVYERMYTHRT
jgi:hypothetical protein